MKIDMTPSTVDLSLRTEVTSYAQTRDLDELTTEALIEFYSRCLPILRGSPKGNWLLQEFYTLDNNSIAIEDSKIFARFFCDYKKVKGIEHD